MACVRIASIVFAILATAAVMTSSFTSSWLIVEKANKTTAEGFIYRCLDGVCSLVSEPQSSIVTTSFVFILLSDFLHVVGLAVLIFSTKKTEKRSHKVAATVVLTAGVSAVISCALFFGKFSSATKNKRIHFGFSYILGWVSVGLSILVGLCCGMVIFKEKKQNVCQSSSVEKQQKTELVNVFSEDPQENVLHISGTSFSKQKKLLSNQSEEE